MASQADELQDFYRVALSANDDACTQCGHGAYYTIVYKDGDEDVEIGSAWADADLAENICELMNMAYDCGAESTLDDVETMVKELQPDDEEALRRG